jgi:tRNA wybutosine-synthesizing protein 3
MLSLMAFVLSFAAPASSKISHKKKNDKKTKLDTLQSSTARERRDGQSAQRRGKKTKDSRPPKQKEFARVDKAFNVAKAQVLAKLQACIDNSKKGGVDAPIENLMNIINTHKDYVTTSSCSGRVAIFSESVNARKQTGVWLLASHDTVTLAQVQDALSGDALTDDFTTIWFKFEPVILHIQCRSLDAAKTLLNTAIGAGMKNSGIMLGKKIMVAVRCSLKIESPIAHDSQMRVDTAYLEMLVNMTSTMFEQNLERKARFEKAFSDRFCSTNALP